ncbi:MAG TPA: hypothetical protein DFS52_25870, partial [Myxococcales bacterium]|nr:hypothetical protein [Myxococcales bacterium]
MAFSVPVLIDSVPVDGVVVADVSIRDPFGRALHTSAVEFTSANTFDQLLGLSVQPSPALLSEGFGQRESLRVTGRFALAGAVDLSGPGHGVGYRSSDENVAVVTPDGQLVARANGETTVEVEYGGFAEEVLVIVDSSAHLDALELLPPGASIPRVGDSLGLRLEGILSDGRRVDLTPGAIGTIWSTSDAATLTVSSNGTATAHRAGSATVFAEHAGRIASLLVDALDGPPEIRLQAPRTVQAGTTLTLRALANDDVRVDYVEFQVDGVPAARDSEAPYEL